MKNKKIRFSKTEEYDSYIKGQDEKYDNFNKIFSDGDHYCTEKNVYEKKQFSKGKRTHVYITF